ncbi:MAG: arginine decarboxylase, pyruvoyl-dependent [Firmicutes bacterium]|nr:arginine decarboxylase, pyruvoyl-dependent [Bacillota bacterium]
MDHLPRPTKYTLVSGASEGATGLNAFDGALLRAGIGNVNLVKVSSILPPGAAYAGSLAIPPGSLVPVAYAAITSETPGDVIAAAVGIGRSRDTFGIIMEFSGHCTREEAEEKVRLMIEDACKKRGMIPADVDVVGVQHKVERAGCAFAAVPMWY